MKKILLSIFSTILFSINTFANNTEISHFEDVIVNVPAKVRIIEGNSYNIEVISNDTIATNAVKYNVENNTLKITSLEDEEWLQNNNICIYITTPVSPVIKTNNKFNLLVIQNNNK